MSRKISITRNPVWSFVAMFVVGLVGCFAVMAFTGTGANASAPGSAKCSASVTKTDINHYGSLGARLSVVDRSVKVTQEQALGASMLQMVADAPGRATSVACSLVVVDWPSLRPLTTRQPVSNVLAWAIVYRGLGPGSHGTRQISKQRDYWAFIDATTGQWLFAVSLDA